MGEERRVGILMCAGCAFDVPALVRDDGADAIAMQDRRLVSMRGCAGRQGGPGVCVSVGQASGTDEAGAASRVDVALDAMATTTCRVGRAWW